MKLVVGIGLRGGTSYEELTALVRDGLHDVTGDVHVVATRTGREQEPALKRLAQDLNAELRTFETSELATQSPPTPSEKVQHHIGTPSVAEAAVLAAGARLIRTKQQSPNATVAIGHLPTPEHDEPAREHTTPAPAYDESTGERITPAPAYDGSAREAVHRVIAERRDVRRGFLDLPVDDLLLTRVLEAAHRAPSVGLSQPWDFLVIRDRDLRRKVHDLATAQRDTFAASLPDDRRAAFDGLKIEAILDAPVNLAVTCDPGRGGRHVLGRHADPRTTWFSAAIAIQNLWLAARAEGLGVGWVSFFTPEEVAGVLGLPAHIELVGYLCVGHVAEFATAPELVRTGWAKRRPLTWAVHHETWGNRDVSIVNEALEAGEPGVTRQAGQAGEPARAGEPGEGATSGQTVHVIIGGDASSLRHPEDLAVDLGPTKPPANFGVLWRHARTAPEATEFGIELARDLALQGIGHLHVRIADRTDHAEAFAQGIATGASASGLRHSSA
ncbi:5,6-dimethylbenzimidazole synthase [Kribbella solani]|uniref:5,6-dimethylbenzimidazole synthase n=1 Tax=Kribbella solani TaxID=236067 RepID=A0A841DPX7_9ACTN|nr:5,6-dimethylbenzimidazole synthase [Kribbella solani]MBB5978816.1 5,6-dimethylbenzimidazole synthase [Kribbella solani]